MKIVYLTSPMIHKASKEITNFNDNLKKVSEEMFQKMYEEEGIGLAGIQVGIQERILVIDIPERKKNAEDGDGKESEEVIEDKKEDGYERHGKFVMINPKFLWKSDEKSTEEEGCLSCPGLRAPVKRPLSVEVEYFDESGKKHAVRATDLLARCIQHEIDHLDGILFIDHLSKLKKDIATKKIEKYLEENEKI
jgi:peptide deformylase